MADPLPDRAPLWRSIEVMALRHVLRRAIRAIRMPLPFRFNTRLARDLRRAGLGVERVDPLALQERLMAAGRP